MLTQDESRFESGDVGVGGDGVDVADNQSDAEGSGSDEEDEVDDDATTEENDDDDEVAMDDDGDEGRWTG